MCNRLIKPNTNLKRSVFSTGKWIPISYYELEFFENEVTNEQISFYVRFCNNFPCNES